MSLRSRRVAGEGEAISALASRAPATSPRFHRSSASRSPAAPAVQAQSRAAHCRSPQPRSSARSAKGYWLRSARWSHRRCCRCPCNRGEDVSAARSAAADHQYGEQQKHESGQPLPGRTKSQAVGHSTHLGAHGEMVSDGGIALHAAAVWGIRRPVVSAAAQLWADPFWPAAKLRMATMSDQKRWLGEQPALEENAQAEPRRQQH